MTLHVREITRRIEPTTVNKYHETKLGQNDPCTSLIFHVIQKRLQTFNLLCRIIVNIVRRDFITGHSSDLHLCLQIWDN